MAFDIKGLGGIKSADKTKAKAKTSGVGGPSFADMLDNAQGAEESAPQSELGGNLAVPNGYVPPEEDLPQDGKGQAKELVNTLKSLAEDALSGSPTAAVSRLEALTNNVDESALTPEQKQVLNEARTRAAVEVAKLKG